MSKVLNFKSMGFDEYKKTRWSRGSNEKIEEFFEIGPFFKSAKQPPGSDLIYRAQYGYSILSNSNRCFGLGWANLLRLSKGKAPTEKVCEIRSTRPLIWELPAQLRMRVGVGTEHRS